MRFEITGGVVSVGAATTSNDQARIAEEFPARSLTCADTACEPRASADVGVKLNPEVFTDALTATLSSLITALAVLTPLPGAGSFQDAEIVGMALVIDDPSGGNGDEMTGATVSMRIWTGEDGGEVPDAFVAVAVKLRIPSARGSAGAMVQLPATPDTVVPLGAPSTRSVIVSPCAEDVPDTVGDAVFRIAPDGGEVMTGAGGTPALGVAGTSFEGSLSPAALLAVTM